MKAVIDADFIPYAVGFKSEKDPVEFALHSAKHMLKEVIKDLGASEYELYLGGRGNFRETAAETKSYKGHRKEAVKPRWFHEIRGYLIDTWKATVTEGYEADDIVSSLLWSDFQTCGGDRDAATVVLVSPDKDLNNTPGWHYCPRKKYHRWITEDQATRHFWYQMLTGDSTDNITGVPKIGPVNAKRILKDTVGITDAEEAVVNAYAEWGKGRELSPTDLYEYFIEQGTLLWMTREFIDGIPVRFSYEQGRFIEQCTSVYAREEGSRASK